MYEMKPEYYTGIAQIDEEHKKLFEIADEAYELYKNEFIPDKYDHIAKILNELRDYTKIHFQHEEEYMKSINYKGMFMQKVQHDQFCQKLDELDLEHLDENSEEVIQEVIADNLPAGVSLISKCLGDKVQIGLQDKNKRLCGSFCYVE